MELVAKKSFRVAGGRRVSKGERFNVSAAIGPIYVLTKNAMYPPREMGPTEREVRALVATLEVAPPTYQTRMMTAETAAPIVPVKRGRGRPRKIRPPE